MQLPLTPTVTELNDRFTRAFAGDLTPDEKTSWFEYGGQDPLLLDNLVAAAKKNQVSVSVTGVRPPSDGVVIAVVRVTTSKGVSTQPVEMVPEGDEWKVSSAFTCQVVKSAGLRSPACPNGASR